MNVEDDIRYLVLALQREGNRKFAQALAPASVTPSQAEALSLLARYEVLSLKELGGLLVCETGDNPSRLIERLVDRGLVNKVQSDLDRRAINLTLTDQGLKVYNAVIEPVEQGMRASIRETLSQHDLIQFRDLLSEFAEVVGANRAFLANKARHLP